MADKKITQFEKFTGQADPHTYFIIASGENAEPDTKNYRLDFTNLSNQVGDELFGGPLPFSGNNQSLHFGIFDPEDDRSINIDLSGDSKFSIKPDLGAFFKDSLTVSGTLYSESHIEGKTCNLEHLSSNTSDIGDSWVKNSLLVGSTNYPETMENAAGESFRQVIDASLNSSPGGLYINARTRDGSQDNIPLLQIDEGLAGGNDPCFVVNSKGNTAVGHKNPNVRLDVHGTSNPLGQNNELIKATATNGGGTEHYLGFGVDAVNSKSWIRSYIDGNETNLIIQNESPTEGYVGIGVADPQAKLHVGGAAIIDGDLTVHGTTTTVNSTTVTVDDTNIELGSTPAPTDTTAEGGGITLKGSTDKEFKWGASADAWRSNVNLQVSHATRPKIDLIRTSAGGEVDGIELASVGDSSNNINARSGIISLTTPQDGTAGATLRFTTINDTTQYDTLFIKDGNVQVGDGIGAKAIKIKSGAGSSGDLVFDSVSDEGMVRYEHTTDSMRFHTNGSEQVRIDSDGNLNVAGDGYFAGNSIPNTAPAVGVYLGKSQSSASHHVSIISADNLESYIDFSTTTRDAIGRIIYANPNSSWPPGQGMSFYADYTTKNDIPDLFIQPNGNIKVKNDIFDNSGEKFAKLSDIDNIQVDPNGGLVNDPSTGLRIKDYGGSFSTGALFTSDKKFKSDVQKIKSPISIIKSIDGVRFKWNDLAPSELKDKQDVGLIAQSVQTVLPEAVGANANSELSVYYHKIIPVLLECIKDQQSQIDSLGKRISDLENG